MNTQDYRARIYSSYTTEKTSFFLSYSKDDYSRDAVPQRRRLRGWLPADFGARCLDVACGAGQTLFMLKQAGYTDIVGVDISQEQVNAARRFWPQVLQADAIDYLRGHAGYYDFVTAYDVVEHFTKDELFEFLDALNCALRPGGRVILQTPNAESPWGMTTRYGDLTHELAFTADSLRHALSLAGFVSFEARECGPYVHGLKSAARTGIWKIIRWGLSLWNLAECGSTGSGIYTRVFIAKADKPTEFASHER